VSQTISEKIISGHAGHPVKAGDIAIVRVDGAMATDATSPFAIRAFREMGGTKLWDPERFFLLLPMSGSAVCIN
jgi:3-isopropylmalate/(R)-2-methylmalate dehydratase large subunit